MTAVLTAIDTIFAVTSGCAFLATINHAFNTKLVTTSTKNSKFMCLLIAFGLFLAFATTVSIPLIWGPMPVQIYSLFFAKLSVPWSALASFKLVIESLNTNIASTTKKTLKQVFYWLAAGCIDFIIIISLMIGGITNLYLDAVLNVSPFCNVVVFWKIISLMKTMKDNPHFAATNDYQASNQVEVQKMVVVDNDLVNVDADKVDVVQPTVTKFVNLETFTQFTKVFDVSFGVFVAEFIGMLTFYVLKVVLYPNGYDAVAGASFFTYLKFFQTCHFFIVTEAVRRISVPKISLFSKSQNKQMQSKQESAEHIVNV